MSDFFVYIGTYTNTNSEGIYVYRLNMSNGSLSRVSSISGIANPSFLDISPDGQFLYAIGEVDELDGKPGGAAASYSVDQKRGFLTHLNTETTVGPGPCHLDIDRSGSYLLVANYGGGSVTLFPIREDGSLGVATDFIQHKGSGFNPNRQNEPHAHSIRVSPNNMHAFVPDLGLDKIMIYSIDLENGKLLHADHSFIEVDPGEGPRHFDFHPNGRFAYVINEIGNTIVAYNYDADHGKLEPIQKVSTLPPGFDSTSHTADIHVHPNGRFLYGSNRGHDSIVICEVNEKSGTLEVLAHEPTGGENPRNFGIDPTGTYLLVANQDTNDIFTFNIDENTGGLTSCGEVAQVPSPVCLKFLPVQSI